MNELYNFEITESYPNTVLTMGIGYQGSSVIDYVEKSEISGMDFFDLIAITRKLSNLSQPNLGLFFEKDSELKTDINQLLQLECLTEIVQILVNHRMLFLVVNLVDDLDIGLVQIVGAIAKGICTTSIGVVTVTLSGKDGHELVQISKKLEILKRHVDSLIIIPIEPDTELLDGESANHQVMLVVKTISDLVNVRGYVNVVYAEISEATQNSGYGFFTFGIASGESKTIKAMEMALSSPTITASQISEAKNILLYISIGQDDVTLDEIVDIIDSIQENVNSECNIIWNACYDSNLGSDLRITIIGTGLEKPDFLI